MLSTAKGIDLSSSELMDAIQREKRQAADRCFIANILRETAKQQNTSITIRFIGTEFSGQSKIMNIFPSQVLLEAVNPPALNRLLKPETKLGISFPYFGGLFTCLTQFVRFQDGISGDFIIVMPEQVELLQRRRHPRVEPSPKNPVTILSINGSSRWLTAKVTDISKSGVGISFAEHPEQLATANFFELELQIARLAKVKVNVRKRNFHQRPDGRYHIGGEFESMPQETEMALSVYVHSQMIKGAGERL